MISLLGMVRFVDAHGVDVELRSPNQRRLLCALALAGGDTIRADYLGETLGMAPSAVRTAVSRLRSLVGDDVIITDGPGYYVRAEIDSQQFEDVASTTTSRGRERFTDLEEALALWHGPAVDEFSHEPWAESDAVRLDELRVIAIEDRAELMIALDRSDEAAAVLTAHVSVYPHRDRPWGLLMQALSVEGRQADALRAYQHYRRLLAEQTGTDPSPAVQAIEQRIIGGDTDERQDIINTLVTADLWPHDTNSTQSLTATRAAEIVPPSGVVTFLFTDVEGSTRLWAADTDAMSASLKLYDEVLRHMVDSHGGYVFSTAGDSFAVAFERPDAAAKAALAVRDGLEGSEWTGVLRLKVRLGIHTGTAEERAGNYFGPDLNRAARLMSAAHGGQVLVSRPTADLLIAAAPDSVALTDLGTHHLRDVSAATHIFQLDAPAGLRTFPQLRSLESPAGNLPVQTTAFFGRSEDIAQIGAALNSSDRLVSLVGAGGIGKTRLALQVAAALVDRFDGGVWFTPLAPVGDDDAVGYAVATALGVTASTGESILSRLTASMQRQPILLVIDNCEHVLHGAARLVQQCLAFCPLLTVVTTSRQPLGLSNEHVIEVGPLDSEQRVAADIFADRARLSGQVISDDDADVVQAICERLDGIPLAIELAAARMRSTSPSELLSRLDQQMRVLAKRARGAVEDTRHLTMREAIDWSYGLLNELDRALFRRLAIFEGSFDLAAGLAVVDDSGVDELDLLDSFEGLVDQSMLLVERGAKVVRYRMLEPLRQYAIELLDDPDELSRLEHRHTGYFLDFVEKADEALTGPNMSLWMDAMKESLPNVRAAHQRALSAGDLDRACTLATKPRTFWIETVGGEQLEWQRATEAAMLAADHLRLPNLWAQMAGSVGMFIDEQQGVEMASRAADRLEQGPDRLAALYSATLYSLSSGRVDEALRWSKPFLEEADAGGLYWKSQAALLHALCLFGSDRDRSQDYADSALENARRLGNESMVALVLANGLTARSIEQAIEQCDEAIDLGNEAGLIQSKGVGLCMRAEYLSRIEDLADVEVFDALVVALRFFERAGSRLFTMMAVEYAARAAAHRGHAAVAAQVFAAQAANDLLPAQALGDGRRHRHAVDAAKEALGPGYDIQAAAGSRLDLWAASTLLIETFE